MTDLRKMEALQALVGRHCGIQETVHFHDNGFHFLEIRTKKN